MSCGGNPDKRVYGNTSRMNAVSEVNGVVRAAVEPAVVQAAHGKALLSSVLTGNDVLTDRAWKRAAKRLVDT